MSSPQSDQLSALVDRVLESLSHHTQAEVAATLGVDATYVQKLRGGWRPSRVRPEILSRLRQLDPKGPSRAVQPAEFYDGILYAAQSMAETQARLIAEARKGLAAHRRPSPAMADLSRAVEDLEAEAAVLEQLPTLPAPAPKKQKRRA